MSLRSTVARIAGEGFRAMFLAALAYAVIAVGFWALWLAGIWPGAGTDALPFGAAPGLWHAHEMVFGYGGASVGGFLLTAVPNWAGGIAVRRAMVAAGALLWLAGRVAVWSLPALPAALAWAGALAFVPFLMVNILRMLLRRPKPQNMVFLAFLMLYWLCDLKMLAAWQADDWPAAIQAAEAGMLALGVMIAVLGGRITPAFTRNAMLREGIEKGLPRTHKLPDRAAIIGILALTLARLAGLEGPPVGAVGVLAGLAQIARMAGWRTGFALGQPILWSLHLGSFLLGLSVLALGLAEFGLGPVTGARHLLGIGAIGGMTLAVMSRAILGHSGRALIAPAPVAAAYALVPLAALARWLAEVGPGDLWSLLVLAAALIWLAAFTATLVALAPAIAGPRAESAAPARPVNGGRNAP